MYRRSESASKMKLETGNVQNYISEKIPSMDDLKKNGENVQSYLTEKIPTMDELKRNGEDVQNYIKDKVPTMADLKRKGSEISEKIPTMDDLKGKSGKQKIFLSFLERGVETSRIFCPSDFMRNQFRMILISKVNCVI